MLQIPKHLEANTTRKQNKGNNCQNYSIITMSPQRSANNYGTYDAIQVRTQNQQIRNDLKIFRSSANTQMPHTHNSKNRSQKQQKNA